MEILDSIVCINLKERADKYQYVKKTFEKLNIKASFYFAEKHNTSGRIGCFESHINVIKKCYENNNNYILIFEDDIVETPSYKEKYINEIMNFLQDNKECYFVQLGYTILPHELISFLSSKNYTKNIIKYNGNSTHAYILSRKGMEIILQNWQEYVYKKEMDLDIYYKEIFKNNGASIIPILFDQNFCIYSDNEKATTNYYKFLREFSCVQYKLSFFYWFSLFRLYINYFILLIFVIVVIFIYIKKFSILQILRKNGLNKIRT